MFLSCKLAFVFIKHRDILCWNIPKSSGLKGSLAHFLAQAWKIKKKRSEKIYIIFSKKSLPIFLEMELSSPKIKKFIFSQKKRFSYILGNRTFLPQAKKNSYISGRNFPSSRNKIFLIFLATKNLRKLFYT